MKTITCDKCGKDSELEFVDEIHLCTVDRLNQKSLVYNSLDLCSDCRKILQAKIKDFINN